MLWETSLLDPEEGIRFRGYSIPELQVWHYTLHTSFTQTMTQHAFMNACSASTTFACVDNHCAACKQDALQQHVSSTKAGSC